MLSAICFNLDQSKNLSSGNGLISMDCKGKCESIPFANGVNYIFMELGSLFSKRQILDCSKLKEFADDNFKFDENSRKFSKQVENTVGKGEIARYEQFLLFPLCFQKTCTPDTKTKDCLGKG